MEMKDTPYHFALKALRKAYLKLFGTLHKGEYSYVERNPDKASDMIYQLLIKDEPCMVARFGSNELLAVANWWSKTYHYGDFRNYIVGNCFQWWPNEQNRLNMLNVAGFYPVTDENLERFAKMMIEDMPLVDLLGSWCVEESWFQDKIDRALKVNLLCLEPYWSKRPWSRVLEGKRILVVHPFAEDISSQYHICREQLFKDKLVLPEFASLRIVKAVQSNGGESNGFNDWFEALEWMKNEMDKEPYDIALIGCGAYGFPLAAHAKRTGHKAVHLGGALQLLFGIKGKRWDNIKYNPEYNYKDGLFNDFWIYPDSKTKPNNSQQVEGECYW